MIAEVADTHAVFWHLYGDLRLSRNAREFIERASATGRKIAISSISMAEIVYLIEKGRIPKGAYENLDAVLSDPAKVFQETPVDNNVILGMQRIERNEVPDMPDRIIILSIKKMNASHLTVRNVPPEVSAAGRSPAPARRLAPSDSRSSSITVWLSFDGHFRKVSRIGALVLEEME